MAITLSTAARNAMADALDALVNTGAGTATLVIKEGATPIFTFDLQNPAFGVAASGEITLQGTPIGATAAQATSTGVDGFDVEDRDGAVQVSGSVGTSAADLIVPKTGYASGEALNLSSGSLTMPATPA